MEEYVIRKAEFIVCQKMLNQWRHEYKVEVLHMIYVGKGAIIMMVKRTKKNIGK